MNCLTPILLLCCLVVIVRSGKNSDFGCLQDYECMLGYNKNCFCLRSDKQIRERSLGQCICNMDPWILTGCQSDDQCNQKSTKIGQVCYCDKQMQRPECKCFSPLIGQTRF